MTTQEIVSKVKELRELQALIEEAQGCYQGKYGRF